MIQVKDQIGLGMFRYGIASRLRACRPNTAHQTTRGGQR